MNPAEPKTESPLISSETLGNLSDDDILIIAKAQDQHHDYCAVGNVDANSNEGLHNTLNYFLTDYHSQPTRENRLRLATIICGCASLGLVEGEEIAKRANELIVDFPIVASEVMQVQVALLEKNTKAIAHLIDNIFLQRMVKCIIDAMISQEVRLNGLKAMVQKTFGFLAEKLDDSMIADAERVILSYGPRPRLQAALKAKLKARDAK